MKDLAAENPYISARREWNERYGHFVSTADFWRKVALWCLTLLSVSVAGVIYIGSQSKLVPYIMKEDGTGRIVSVGFPTQGAIDDRVIRANLAEWIGWHRSVTADSLVQRQFVDRTYAFILKGSAAKATLDQWYTDGHDPFTRMQSEAVTVQVQSVLALSEKTYQVEWGEAATSKSGQLLSHKRFRALLSVETREVNGEILLRNPLGVFIQSISIQEIGA